MECHPPGTILTRLKAFLQNDVPNRKNIWSEKQKADTGIALLIITTNGPLEDSLFPTIAALNSAELEVLILRVGTILPGNRAIIPLYYKLWAATWAPLGSSCPSASRQEKRSPSWLSEEDKTTVTYWGREK